MRRRLLFTEAPQSPNTALICSSSLSTLVYRYFFATLLSLYNKWMFSPLYYGFTYPLFVTANHMVVQFFLAWVVRLVWSERFRPREKPGKEDYV